MSLFVNLSKSLADYIARTVAPKTTSSFGTNAIMNSDIIATCARWCDPTIERRKSKSNLLRSTSPPSSSSRISQNLSSAHDDNCCERQQQQQQQQHSAPAAVGLLSSSNNRPYKPAGVLSKLCLALALKDKPFSTLYQHQVVRTKCGRENCADPCITFPVCRPQLQDIPNKDDETMCHNIYEAYWEDHQDEECFVCDPCDWTQPHPRFDELYHQESDKLRRSYSRTWNECLPIIKPKKICCYDGIPPELCQRPKRQRPQTACTTQADECEEVDPRCIKITVPCCRGVARRPPTCKIRHGRKCTKKFCTPYPSFSECKKPKFRVPKPVECSCLTKISNCEIYAYWRNRILSRLGSCQP